MFFQTVAVAALAGAASAIPTFPARRAEPSSVSSGLHIGTPAKTNGTNSTTPAGGFKQVVYWGQIEEKPLADVCAKDEGVDTVVLSFINQYGNMTADGAAIGNFNWTCVTNATNSGKDQWTYDQCQAIGKDVKTCQSLGVKVLGSIGGAVDYSVLKEGDGQKLADSLWNSFAGGKGTKVLGGASLDGFDFDVEKGDATANKEYGAAIDALRKNFGSDGKYLITGAPQCPKSEHYMTDMINTSKFDELYIQFYNNQGCSTNTPDGVSQAWDDWYNKVQAGASKGANLYLGMPSAKAAAGDGYKGGADPYYLEPAQMGDLVNQIKQKKGFSGVMLWDAGNAMNNTANGCDYQQQVRSVLDKGKVC